MSLSQSLGEFYPPSPKYTEHNVPDLSGKVYLITGGTSGIGLALAKILYSKNARVYITSRTKVSAENAINKIKKDIPVSQGQIAYITLDLTDLSTIAPAVKGFLAEESQLHSVWYNAGVMNTPTGSRTRQGYEIQWGTNVVAHFLINKLLMPILLSTAQVAPKGSVRSVWVSSDGHNYYSPKPDGIDWNEISIQKSDGWKGGMSVMKYYGQSKAGDVILSKETATRYGEQGIVSVVSSTLIKN
ncbi:MAG: hypothetical protein M1812_000355 [Candelaria pacifica]|nr:MAG: hypothetical protein M1812_000355 [Candelaria pacifica]